MDHGQNWQITEKIRVESARKQSHVQAWARDSLTGEPVYILQLGRDRKGKKSRCECQSCDLPLLAVNAGKTEYINRPHFRHPNGAEKTECLYLAARLAALELLRTHGVFELPARRVLGRVTGLSGMLHEVWVEYPAERIKIRNFDFQDKASAVITLDDGRQLRFQLIGSGSLSDDGQVIPSVYLDLKDAAFAGMSPEELCQRTTLVPEGLCWHSHWNDADLQRQANDAAQARAVDFVDVEGEYLQELESIEPKFRRETLLHLVVKKILSEAKQIYVPEIRCFISRTAEDGYELEKTFNFPSQMILLADVALEKRFGNLIPDVTAKTALDDGGLLLIEVTVTNTITAERLEQIRNGKVPALEIDLSSFGGLISRSVLRDLVIEDLRAKRWLCHPKSDLIWQEMTEAIDAELKERNDGIQRKEEAQQLALQLVRKTSVDDVAKDYLNAIYLYERHRNSRVSSEDKIASLYGNITIQAKRLEHHGFGAAMDDELFGSRAKIIPRILAIKNGGGVGYELDSTMGIMNAIKQTQSHNRTFHTLYLIAEAVYRKTRDFTNPDAWYLAWIAEIKRSIHSGEKMYVRTRRYDSLLSLLFPEMRVRLEASFGTENHVPNRKTNLLLQTLKTP